MNRLLATSFLAFCMLLANAAFADQAKMTRVQTFAGKKYFGPVVVESDDAIQMFDIATALLVKLNKPDLKVRVDNIDELISESYVSFPSYAAWKLGQMTKSGRLEALVVHNSEKGVFFNTGASDGVQAGQRCVLLTEPETIVDPVTEEVLGVIRERVGVALPLLVRGDRLSQIDFEAASQIANITEKQIRDAFTVGRSVEIERPVRRIAIAPPKWTATKDAESLEDEANFLHSHLIAEMVRHGITVISKQQIDFIQKSIAEDQKKDVADVTDIEIAKKANADVMVSAGMLAKGTKIETLLEITNLASNEYAGAILGTSRLKADRKDATRAIAFAKGLEIVKSSGLRITPVSLMFFSQVDAVKISDSGELAYVEWKNKPIPDPFLDIIANSLSLKAVYFNRAGITDQHVARLAKLSNLEWLVVDSSTITEKSLAYIRQNHPRLIAFHLAGTSALTDRGLLEISQMKHLAVIRAGGTTVSNASLFRLQDIRYLHELDLPNSNLNDEGLEHISKIKSLRALNVRKSGVTPEGIAKIKEALPGCNIAYEF